MKLKIRTLFLDVGGVLLTNGWDRNSRKKASEHFSIDYAEMDSRHHLTFDTYEVGKLSLDEYLTRIVFYEPRSFSREDFKEFMFSQSKPYSDMLNFVRKIKQQYNLKIAVVSNEGRELTVHRIKKFRLGEFVDFFIVSSFVHLRKPDLDIYRLALDVAQVLPEDVIYIEDRSLFVDVARSLGVHSIHHTDPQFTSVEVERLIGG